MAKRMKKDHFWAYFEFSKKLKSQASTRKNDHYVPKLFYQIRIRLRNL